MKTHHRLSPLFPILLLALWIPLVLTPGCQGPRHGTYLSLGAVAHSVDLAMTGWADWYTDQKSLTTEPARLSELEAQRRQVDAVYGDYQGAMRLAREAIHGWYLADPVGTNAPPVAAMDAALMALESSRNELLNLITRLTK